MSFHTQLPTWFLVVVVIVVAIFILKKLIKFALIVGAIGFLIWLLWSQDVIGKISGKLVLP